MSSTIAPAPLPESILREIGAYEELWLDPKQTFPKLAKRYEEENADSPAGLVGEEVAAKRAEEVRDRLETLGASAIVAGTDEFPEEFVKANPGVRLLYYRGNLNLLKEPGRIAVIGSRDASEGGVNRAKQLAREIADHGWVVFSGLAKGIDTAAHKETLEAKGKTVAVIGTPITEAYPKENRNLQEQIAIDHLLVSQVPMIRYSRQNPMTNRGFFPLRNATMSALSCANVIAEAGEKSGTLIQAKAALRQGRLLCVHDSCFRSGLVWPEKLVKKGAIRITSFEQIESELTRKQRESSNSASGTLFTEQILSENCSIPPSPPEDKNNCQGDGRKSNTPEMYYIWAGDVNCRSGTTSEHRTLIIVGSKDCESFDVLVQCTDVPESIETWSRQLQRLKDKEISPILVTSSGSEMFWSALRTVFPNARRQICWARTARNAPHRLPENLRMQAVWDLRGISHANSREEAEAAAKNYNQKHQCHGPDAMLDDIDHLLTFYEFPEEHRVILRDTALLEYGYFHEWPQRNRYACERRANKYRPIFNHHSPKIKLRKIDLPEGGTGHFLIDYISGGGPDVNRTIKNLKRAPGTRKWAAILEVAESLSNVVTEDQSVIFVPMPPSKAMYEPRYDDRLVQILMRVSPKIRICELILRAHSIPQAHKVKPRPSFETVRNSLFINEADVPTGGFPCDTTIVVFDDVVTLGTNFRACQDLLKYRFPCCRIEGLFVARTVRRG